MKLAAGFLFCCLLFEVLLNVLRLLCNGCHKQQLNIITELKRRGNTLSCYSFLLIIDIAVSCAERGGMSWC